MRFRLFNHDCNNTRSIERGGQQVVSKAWVLHFAIVHDYFFHYGKTETLSNATLKLSNSRKWVEYSANILGCCNLDHLDQTEFNVDVHNCSVRHKGKRNVTVALTIFVQIFSLAVMVLKCFRENDALSSFSDTDTKCSNSVDDVGVFNHQPNWVNVVLFTYVLEKSFSNQSTCAIDGATTHPCLSRGGSRTCGSNLCVGCFKHYIVNPKHATCNLRRQCHESLTNFRSRELQ